jgi:hypothetical protein
MGMGVLCGGSPIAFLSFFHGSYDWCFLGLIQTILGPGRRLALNSELDLGCVPTRFANLVQGSVGDCSYSRRGAQGVLELIEWKECRGQHFSDGKSCALGALLEEESTNDHESCVNAVRPFDLVLLADVAYEAKKKHGLSLWPPPNA